MHDDEPTVLGGDLNARPDAPEMQPLFALFGDVWDPERDGGPGFTIPADPDRQPDRRIDDYVFVSPGVADHAAAVPISALTRLASDHYPVRADIALPGSAVGLALGVGK